MATTVMLQAQDTLDYQLYRYYYNCWPGDSLIEESQELCFTLGPQVSCKILGGGELAKRFIVEGGEGPLQVYGIAAALTTRIDLNGGVPTDPSSLWWDYYNRIYDKSLNDCYEFLRIYKRSADSLVWMDQVRVHRLIDTPAYYFNAGQYACESFRPVSYLPMYEQFFDSVISVPDTFYVGMTQRTWQDQYIDEKGGRWSWKQMGFDNVSLGIRGGSHSVFFPESIKIKELNLDTVPVWSNSAPWMGLQYYILVFPILTPPDSTVTPIDSTVTPIDSTVTPVDSTLGVNGVDMVGRYVSVSPNPAGDRATVLSSFGLTAIEAYDPQGRKLYTLPATGLKAELDVSAWPRGTVLLHIHTPAGTTVKRLLLR